MKQRARLLLVATALCTAFLVGTGCRGVTRSTSAGNLNGTTAQGAEAYRGVFYAEAPIGEHRFAPPVPKAFDASAEIDASAFGPKCPQRTVVFGDKYEGEEDCLALNVWTPEGATAGRNRPVLFFVHGGGLMFGSSSDSLLGKSSYDGAEWAAEQDAVVVTVNYRLGALGFLALDEFGHETLGNGNWGMLDVIEALRWVQSHIESFGGDPDRVLLFGESGGGQMVCGLVASPLAADLFSSAIVQSGSCLQPDYAVRNENSRTLLDTVGCAPDDAETCLRSKPAQLLVEALKVEISPMAAGINTWGLTVDGTALAQSPHRVLRDGGANRVPLVIGTNADENGLRNDDIASCAELEDALTDNLTTTTGAEVLDVYGCDDEHADELWRRIGDDVRFHCPANVAAEGAAAHQPTYRYLFDKSRERGALTDAGAFHGLELGYLFGGGNLMTQNEETFATSLRALWTEFAASGEWSDWPRFDRESYATVRLTDAISVDDGAPGRHCDFWATRLPLDAQGLQPE